MWKITFRALNTRATFTRARKEPKFGKLSTSGRKVLATHVKETYYPDDPDGYDKEEFDLGPRKNAYHYKYDLVGYAKKGPAGLKKSLMLFEEMKSKDRLKPEYLHFARLINACGKIGYTQKAFELYDEYLRHDNEPSKPLVNSLINSCSECPFREYGLAKLKWLRDTLKVDHDFTFNLTNYNTMIKAYGRLGDMTQIEGVIDEMFQQNLYPDLATFNMLLMACASNKVSGTTLALSTYKRLKMYEFKPDIATYRIFLRCIRDCGLGSKELLKKTFADLPAMTTLEQRIRVNSKLRNKNTVQQEPGFVWMPQIDSLKDDLISTIRLSTGAPPETNLIQNNNIEHDRVQKLDKNCDENDSRLIQGEEELSQLMSPQISDNNLITIQTTHSNLVDLDDRLRNDDNYSAKLPNLLSDDHLDLFTRIDSIQLNKVASFPYHRLMLFGGMHGFLERMVQDGVRPCSKTFGLLLGCLPPRRSEIIEFYRLALDYGVRKDVGFYDMLIKQAAWNAYMRDRLELAMYFLDRMQRDTDLVPQITTYESLAHACDNIEQATELIRNLESCGFSISTRMLRNFFDPPMMRKDFSYLNELVILCRERKYNPPKKLIDKLEGIKLDAHDVILRYEKEILTKAPDWFNRSKIKHFDEFTENLDKWLKSVTMDEEDHPWEQFYVERKSKRQGFVEFVAKFKAIEQAKQEALASGQKLGNLMEEADKILSAKKTVNKRIVPSEERLLIDEDDDDEPSMKP